MARRGTPLITALVATTVLLGCANDPVADPATGGDGPTTTGDGPTTTAARTTIPIPTTTLPDLTSSRGLAASIRQFREDEVAGVIQLELVRERGGEGVLGVDSLQLHWPGLTEVPPTAHFVAVGSGQRVDIPTPLGGYVCPADGSTPTYAGAYVTASVSHPPTEIAPVVLRLPLLADAQTALDNVHGKGCVRQRLLDRVGLAYSSPWMRSDPGGVPTATADLVITRKDTDEVISVTGVDGSVLLFVNPAAPLPNPGSTVAAGASSASVPVIVTGAGRCDGHALGDSKKTYVFQVQVRVGDDEPVGIDLPVPEADRPLLNQVIVDTCGSDHRR